MNNALLNPRELEAHSLFRHLPPVDTASAEYNAIESSIRERGIDNAILITPSHEILDGRHRWTAALNIGLESVPVKLVCATEAAEIILGSIMERRHYSKGARAYIAVPLLKQFTEANSARYSANLKTGKNPRNSRFPLEAENWPRMPVLAARLGLSEDVFERGRKLHAIYAQDPEYKAETEAKLLAGDVGLGALIAGYAGRRATAGKERANRHSLQLFASSATTLIKRFGYWTGGDPAGQKEAWKAIRDAAETLEVGNRRQLADWLVSCARQLRKGAKKRRDP